MMVLQIGVGIVYEYATELFTMLLEIRESNVNQRLMPFGRPLSNDIKYDPSVKRGSNIPVAEIKDRIKTMKVDLGKKSDDINEIISTYNTLQKSKFPYFESKVTIRGDSFNTSLGVFALNGTPNTFKFFNLDVDDHLDVYVLGSEFSVYLGNIVDSIIHNFTLGHGSSAGRDLVSRNISIDFFKTVIEQFKTGNFSVDSLGELLDVFTGMLGDTTQAGSLAQYSSVLLNFISDADVDATNNPNVDTTIGDIYRDFMVQMERSFMGFVETQKLVKWFMLGVSSYCELMTSCGLDTSDFLDKVVTVGRDRVSTLSGFGNTDGYSTSVALGGITTEFFKCMTDHQKGVDYNTYLDNDLVLSTMSEYDGGWDNLVSRSIFDMLAYSDEDLIITEAFLDEDMIESASNYMVMKIRKNREFFNEDTDSLVDGVIDTFYDTTFTSQYKERISGAVEIADYDSKGDGLVLGNLSKMKILSSKILDKISDAFI